MINEIDGPRLRDRIRNVCFPVGDPGHVVYYYTDDMAKRTPEYAATHIVVRAYFMSTNPDKLRALESTMAELPGCVSTERIEYHRDLRPQVVAMYNRQRAMEK